MNRRPPASSGYPKFLLTGGVIAAGVVGLVAFKPEAIAQGNKVPVQNAAPRLLVEAITPGRLERTATVTLTGQVEAERTATVAAEVADRVLTRPVERGQRVEAGQMLARLNDDLVRVQIAQAEAAAERAVAGRKQAEAEYARAVVETGAAISQANAQLQVAQAAELKTRTATRRQELLQAQAALDAARAEEALARKDFDRYTVLVKEDTLPQQALDRAQTALDAAIARRQAAEQAVSLAQEGARQEDIATASAQVALAKAGVEATSARPQRLEAIRRQIEGLKAQEAEARTAVAQARIALAKRTITAPFGGRVLETPLETGEMAAPGTPVVRIADVRMVKALFALPEALRNRLRVSQSVTLTADALPGRTFAGQVKTLGFEADSRARTFLTEIAIRNPQEALLPGMVVRLSVATAPTAQSRVTIPVSAIASDGSENYVFVLENGQANRRRVVLGKPVGATEVEVRDGLNGNEQIASAPQRLTDKAQVEILTREARS